MSSQGKYAVEKKDPLKPFYPIIGLVIMGIAIAVGWFSAPFILDFADDFIPADVITSLKDVHPLAPELLVTFLVVLIVGMLFSAIFAIFAPKQEKSVTENSLKAERAAREAERRRTKARKRKMKARMREGSKGMDEI